MWGGLEWSWERGGEAKDVDRLVGGGGGGGGCGGGGRGAGAIGRFEALGGGGGGVEV